MAEFQVMHGSESRNSAWAILHWVPQRGFEGIHPQDRDAISKLEPTDKVFRVEGHDGALVVLRYGEIRIRVNPQLIRPVPAPVKNIGDQVLVARTSGIAMGFIIDIRWHGQRGEPWFHVRLANGKKLSRRNFAEDLGS